MNGKEKFRDADYMGRVSGTKEGVGRTPEKRGFRVRTAVPWGGPSGIRHHLAMIFFLLLSARVTQLIRGFGSSWKSSVESLSQDVMRSFTNFRNGTSIIQVTCNSRSPLPPRPITGLPSSFLRVRNLDLRSQQLEHLSVPSWLDLQLPAMPKVLAEPEADGYRHP